MKTVRSEEANHSDQPAVMARALYDFTPQREDELAFKAGDEMVYQ